MLATLLTAAIAVVGASAATPKPPTLTFLYSINITMAATQDIGVTPIGDRGILPINGGSFSGPKLSGNVTAGLDWGLTDSKGTFSPEAVYVLQTTDGAKIMVTERGRAPNVILQFDTGHANYSWLNTAVGYASGGPSAAGISLDVWQLTPPS
ncbi:hypothetical protein SEUCBS139899_008097 [Sporothrix eucalyptigena]|uniref:Uncharacterized protein n=1 Tax=Sporothrix eucalyptigena TaxID=1812306 RepID=A0ABP0D0R7_9PEZI